MTGNRPALFPLEELTMVRMIVIMMTMSTLPLDLFFYVCVDGKYVLLHFSATELKERYTCSHKRKKSTLSSSHVQHAAPPGEIMLMLYTPSLCLPLSCSLHLSLILLLSFSTCQIPQYGIREVKKKVRKQLIVANVWKHGCIKASFKDDHTWTQLIL